MNEIKVRGIDKSKIEKLKELAKRNNYPSLNSYLLDKLNSLAEENEELEYRKKYLEAQEVMIQTIEKNTEVMLQLLNLIGGDEEED